MFDTETTGLKGDVVQMAYVVLDAEGREIDSYCKLWRPAPGVQVHPRAYEVHKISDADLQANGCDTKAELSLFFEKALAVQETGGCLVAHNARFDKDRTTQTAERFGLQWPSNLHNPYCTMQSTVNLVGLTKCNGHPKPPKNSELYFFLFATEPKGQLHDALVDARITAQSFAELRRRDWWFPPNHVSKMVTPTPPILSIPTRPT